MQKEEYPRFLILYLGTRRLAALVGERGAEKPKILRFAQTQHAEGFQKGEVTQLDKALQAVEDLLKKLELGEEAFEIPTYVLLSNARLKMTRFSSSIYYQGYPKPVTAQEVRRVVEQTKSVAPLPLDDWVLELVPESFWVNDLEGVENPVGLEAQRLAVTLQIFTTSYAAFRNVSRLFESLELKVEGYFPKTLVLPEGVLNPTEKEGETLILDISDETTHLVLTRENKIVQTKSLEFGSSYFTNRIAEKWHLGPRDAECLLERFGSLEEKLEFGEELIPLVEQNGRGNHQIKRAEFHHAFSRFGEEFMNYLHREVKHFLTQEKLAFPQFVATGGGVKLEGLLDALNQKFGVSVRLGAPRGTEGTPELLRDPSWAGPAGLLNWLGRQENGRPLLSSAKADLFGRTLVQVKDWLAAYF